MNFVSVRVGSKYGADYVNRLHDMLARHYEGDQVHFCITDDPNSLPPGINPIPADPAYPGWWQKVRLFEPGLFEGLTAYFDLDVVITGRLEDLKPGIIADWMWPCYNSSVMVWEPGDHAEIFTKWTPDLITAKTRLIPPECLPKGQDNGGDQEWITEVSTWETFPAEWFLSYKMNPGWPPNTSKAVVFNGKPKPDEVEGWVQDVWKIGGFTVPPKLDGMNVSSDYAYDNIRANVQRDLPWFTGFDKQERDCVIVCGGPSMRGKVSAIRDRKRRGAKIVTVNNALGYLMDNGLTPDTHVMLDARPENVEMIRDAPKIKYFIASQVHPSVFDALEGRDVTLWHSAMHSGEEMREIVEPWWDTRPVIFVPGGGTVGLRTLWLAQLSGYKTIHIYGMDSSYSNGEHHAYPQALNDEDGTVQVKMGENTYKCAAWMVRQAKEFEGTKAELEALGVKLFVHGEGLIPDIARR